MRLAVIVALAGLCGPLGACSNQPKASNEQLEQFKPPMVRDRGDVVPRQQARFARLDKNGDGFVAADELPPRLAGRLAEFDGDKDGKLSRSEMVEGALDRFDRLDTSKDGKIDAAEREAAMARMRERRPGN
mgnify:CR=1 FL=1